MKKVPSRSRPTGLSGVQSAFSGRPRADSVEVSDLRASALRLARARRGVLRASLHDTNFPKCVRSALRTLVWARMSMGLRAQQLIECSLDYVRIDAQFQGPRAVRRQRFTRPIDAGIDEASHLLDDLPVDGRRALGMRTGGCQAEIPGFRHAVPCYNSSSAVRTRASPDECQSWGS
jgi:hypothetical protein